VLTSVVDAYDADAEAGGQDIVAEIEPGVVVMGDSNLLTQMMASLVENALRHCPAKTTVTLHLWKDANGRPVVVVADTAQAFPRPIACGCSDVSFGWNAAGQRRVRVWG